MKKKLDEKAKKLQFIGYTNTVGNYKVWDEAKQKCYIRHDVIFNESDFKRSSRKSECETQEPKKNIQINLDYQQEEVPDDDQSDANLPRRSDRVRKPCIRYGIHEYVNHVAFLAAEIEEPSTIEEALSGSNSKEWKTAADSEYQSLIENDTWELVNLPPDQKAIGCKWFFE